MLRRLASALLACLLLVAPAQAAKNLIIMIPDGVGAAQYTLARWYKGAPLNQDPILCGAVKTHIADSVIADSAPAASAYATGVRTSDKVISMGPRPGVAAIAGAPPADLAFRPLATILEGARLTGRATGVVSTSRVTHATPAAFMAHAEARYMEDSLMEQAVHQGFDLVLGGGMRSLLPKAAGGSRKDGADLTEVLARRGYALVGDREGLLALEQLPAFGLFAKSHMEPDIDRPRVAPEQPTLAEMTRKAIELLAAQPQGFVLMVEASQVDWADHANDPAYLMSELMAWDAALGAALEFARADGETLLVALSDHNTGGMSIGNARTDLSYSQTGVEALLAPLRGMKATGQYLWEQMGREITPERLQAEVAKWWGLEISLAEAAQVLETAGKAKIHPREYYPSYALGEVLCPRYTVLGWNTHGHVGGDVPLFAYGPGAPSGTLDAPEVGQRLARYLGLDLASLTRRLFMDAEQAFPAGAVTLDQSDPANPVVVVSLGEKVARLPVDQDLLFLDGETLDLEGVVVWSPSTGKVYLPAQAVEGIKAAAR